ncbi:MAG TPA: YciI family protein [Nitrospira sp.]|nr:YciI family protein [Nitrospira sp.]
MKYLCLVYLEENVLNAMAKPERQSLSDESIAFCNDLQNKGQLIAASPLHPVETATTVRVRNGKTSATDGPFAETKEQLGGFLAIDVRDLNDAIRVAAHFPAARYGSIEVRPMKELGCAE